MKQPPLAIQEWAARKVAEALWRAYRYGWTPAPRSYFNYAGGRTVIKKMGGTGGAYLQPVHCEWNGWEIKDYINPADLKSAFNDIEPEKLSDLTGFLRSDPTSESKCPPCTPEELEIFIWLQPRLVKLDTKAETKLKSVLSKN